ncbi:MAG: nuclear transport factor 2 family protein [Balneolaceae bacterium]|nr:nuclear transport factor 2 family protein [Balneolaceae bacterium]
MNFKRTVAILLLLNLSGLFADEIRGQEKRELNQAKILKTYFERFNAHDLPGMLTHVSDDFQLYYILPDSVMLDIHDSNQLRSFLNRYFIDYPNVRSEISDITQVGNLVTFIEVARWGENGVNKQSSLAVYEFRKGKISRAWYYQAER